MARRKKEEKISPEEKLRLKKLRAAQRREERKKRKAEGQPALTRSGREKPPAFDGIELNRDRMVRDNFEWIGRSMASAYAWKIVNSHRERPYWVSIHFEGANPPVSQFYPCSMFRRGKRYFYGFLFRECRDECFRKWRKEYKARKHFLDQNNRPI